MSGAVTSGPPDKNRRERAKVEASAEEGLTGEASKQEDSKQSLASATDFLIASKQCEILSLENFRRMGKLVVAISELVHALQRERGSSNLYLGSGGDRYGEWLTTMIADSDEKLDHFHATLVELDTDISAAPGDGWLFSRIAYTLHALSELAVLRTRVQSQTLNPESAIAAYSEVLRSLLSVVFEAADVAMDPDISRTLVAMFNFMQGKELAGQERAVGAAGFTRGQFSAGLVERMEHLAEAQDRCFELFADFADMPAAIAWKGIRDSPDQEKLEHLRALAVSANANLQQEANVEERWFWLATARIDGMKTIEHWLQTRLRELCDEKLEEARDELSRHQTLIDKLLSTESEADDSFIVFCGTGSVTQAAQRDVESGIVKSAVESAQPESLRSDGVSPRLGRSIIELLHSQSERLHSITQELNVARTALEERRALDRAKLLLMKHHNMTEEAAYRLLRQTAMNQNRALVDVARAMVAIADA